MSQKETKTDTLGRKRSVARLKAVQALYQWHITKAPAFHIIEEFLNSPILGRQEDVSSDISIAPFDEVHFGRVITGVLKHQAEIHELVGQHLDKGWPAERIDYTLASILYASTYELIYCHDIPPKVVINEYINIAHAFFGGGDMPRVVNGALHSLSQHLKKIDAEK